MKKFVALLLLGATFAQAASAKNSGQWGDVDPAQAQFYEGLMQPDNATTSCCGSADAYFADEVEEAPDGSTIAIITDTRDDAALKRTHIAVGTKFVIPPNKIRKPASANPTGHNILFYGNGWVYCWEPVAKG